MHTQADKNDRGESKEDNKKDEKGGKPNLKIDAQAQANLTDTQIKQEAAVGDLQTRKEYGEWCAAGGNDAGTALEFARKNHTILTKAVHLQFNKNKQVHDDVRDAICQMMGGFRALDDIEGIKTDKNVEYGNITIKQYSALKTVAQEICKAANNQSNKNRPFDRYVVNYLNHFISNLDAVSSSGASTNQQHDFKTTINRIVTQRDQTKKQLQNQQSLRR